MSLIKWNNRSLFPSFNSSIDDFFNEPFYKNADGMMNLPATNVEETDESFIIKMAIPGMEKSDINVETDQNLLTVSAEKEVTDEEKEKNYTRKEYSYNSFKRTFTLPENVKREEISAVCENGELRLSLPKTEVTINDTKQIEVA